MPRLEPLSMADLASPEQAAVEAAEQLLGFVANDALTMARWPALMHGFADLVRVIYAPGALDNGLRRLIGLASSSAAGCSYCMGHTVNSAQMHGVDDQKLAAIHNFATAPQFSAAERAALAVAFHAGESPNRVTDEMFAELDKHFDQQQQLEIVAVIALFGFLNRWNSTLATELESRPAKVLHELLSAQKQ